MMACVFIRYRRADGQYAVGWIEERLRLISGDAGVTTAFRDSDLAYGDNVPDRLAPEVDSCDVPIAVISPNSHGHNDERAARILDPAGGVGREISNALNDADELIIAVLMSGVEPLRPVATGHAAQRPPHRCCGRRRRGGVVEHVTALLVHAVDRREEIS